MRKHVPILCVIAFNVVATVWLLPMAARSAGFEWHWQYSAYMAGAAVLLALLGALRLSWAGRSRPKSL